MKLRASLLALLLLVSCDSALRNLYGSFQSPNPDNCSLDATICQSLSTNAGAAVCDQLTSRCVATGRCEPGQASCATPDLPLCTPEGVCTACGVAGDAFCQARAKDRQDGRPLCASGACVECRTSTDCQSRGEASICDGQTHTCRGCVKNEECAASGVCRTDAPSLGAASTGYRCASVTEIAYVDSTPGVCSAAGPGSLTAPFCQLTQAAAAAKTFIKIQPWTAQSVPYSLLRVDTSGLTVQILGPGRDGTLPIQWAGLVVTQGKVTLTDVGVARDAVGGGTQPLITCEGGEILLRRVLVRGGNRGIITQASCSRITLYRSRLEGILGRPLDVQTGVFRVLNSAIVGTRQLMGKESNSLTLGPTASGLFAFNTLHDNFDNVDCQGHQFLTDTIFNTPVGLKQIGMNCQVDRISERATLTASNQMMADDTTNAGCCIDAGQYGALQLDAETREEMTSDYFGNARPARGALDIGYHELK